MLIWIQPPSAQALQERLEAELQDTSQAIAHRLRLAREEMAAEECNAFYNYLVINDSLEEALAKLAEIIRCELE